MSRIVSWCLIATIMFGSGQAGARAQGVELLSVTSAESTAGAAQPAIFASLEARDRSEAEKTAASQAAAEQAKGQVESCVSASNTAISSSWTGTTLQQALLVDGAARYLECSGVSFDRAKLTLMGWGLWPDGAKTKVVAQFFVGGRLGSGRRVRMIMSSTGSFEWTSWEQSALDRVDSSLDHGDDWYMKDMHPEGVFLMHRMACLEWHTGDGTVRVPRINDFGRTFLVPRDVPR